MLKFFLFFIPAIAFSMTEEEINYYKNPETQNAYKARYFNNTPCSMILRGAPTLEQVKEFMALSHKSKHVCSW